LDGPDAVALSPSGRRVAVSQGDIIEVRAVTGELLLKAQRRLRAKPVEGHPRVSLKFLDEEQLVHGASGEEPRAFRIVDGACTARRKADPPGWTVMTAGVSIFDHQGTRTRIALPVKGPWVANPARPTILACDDAHVELRA